MGRKDDAMASENKTGTRNTPKADIRFKKQIGDTTYIVEYLFRPTARETAYEKLKKLILSDASSLSGRTARCYSPA